MTPQDLDGEQRIPFLRYLGDTKNAAEQLLLDLYPLTGVLSGCPLTFFLEFSKILVRGHSLFLRK